VLVLKKMPIIVPTLVHDIRSYFLSLASMKRIVPIILLSLFLYNVSGYYFTFSVLAWQNNSKSELMVQQSKSLETVRIPGSEIKNVIFIDNGKEISYKGDMFDVKYKIRAGDDFIFYCIKDNQEKALLEQLNNHIQNTLDIQSSSKENSPEKSGCKNIIKDYILNLSELSFYYSFQKNTSLYRDKVTGECIVSLSSPPPKVT
jgi:hypothetical protein